MGRTTRRMAFSGMVRLRGRFNYRYVACLQSRRLVDKEKNEETMTDLTTKTARSLHDKWCEQMREKGMHGPDKRCSRLVRLCPDPGLYVTWHCGDSLDPANYNLDEARCDQFNSDLVYWLNLPESRRQEYLATAKAVLPEIVGEVFDECVNVSRNLRRLLKDISGEGGETFRICGEKASALYKAEKEMLALRARRLEELK